ncbi:hypothetical protein A1Q2_06205 [Trichosporon asahii var. asahii CBS 8904]|uniref:RING-type domain-containing protein n=1 Tax=Trichosporon asahii var. asahii (strain CBS 8904) TaxID=1220162 RepID=K1WCV9_TRIAC|nr:hypothetical protein A1Q2_06205 [Trichosporon asahii var. asahii CBS 8904]
MPKAGKGKAAQKEAAKKHSAPYSRDKPASDDKSNHSIQDDGKPSRKRRKTKGQDLNAEASSSSKKEKGDEILDRKVSSAETAEAESKSVERGGSSTQPAPMQASTSETAIEQEKSKKSRKDSEHSASPEPKKKKTKHELRELQARFQDAQVAADAAQAELQKKIAELEKTVAEQAAQLEAKTTTIDNTNKVGFWWVPTLTSASRIYGRAPQRRQGGSYVWNLHGRHRRASRCGHTACRTCLLQWFRSPTAYPAPDIENVEPEDDLTYRTKQCHLCRENVYIRPVRVFAVGDIAESIGLTRTKSSPAANKVAGAPAVAKSETDLWAKTFPPDTTSYVSWDDADGVWRCPKCGCEVASGECQGCHAQFSDADDSSDSDDEDDEDEDDDMSGGESDIEPEVYRPVIRTALPGRRPARDSDDDSVHASHLLNTLDLLADEASEEEGSYDSDSGSDRSRGSSDSSPTPTSTPTLYPRRDLYPDDEDLEAAGDEGYESSFIDDTDGEAGEEIDRGSESEVSVAGIGENSEDEIEERVERKRHRRDRSGGRSARRNDSDEDDVQIVDEPSVDELRARRAARFGGGEERAERADSSQPVHRRSRRVIEVSDDE